MFLTALIHGIREIFICHNCIMVLCFFDVFFLYLSYDNKKITRFCISSMFIYSYDKKKISRCRVHQIPDAEFTRCRVYQVPTSLFTQVPNSPGAEFTCYLFNDAFFLCNVIQAPNFIIYLKKNIAQNLFNLIPNDII